MDIKVFQSKEGCSLLAHSFTSIVTEKELARIEATQRELKRKQADIKEHYALCVEAFLHSATVIHLQVNPAVCFYNKVDAIA